MIKAFLLQNQIKFRFLLAGGLNTIVGLGLFPLMYIVLKKNGIHYLVVFIISQLICISFSYITNKFFVFRTKGNYFNEFFKFSSFYFLYFILNIFVLPLMVEVFNFTPIATQFIFSFFIIVSSFFWHSKLSFSKKNKH